MKFILLVLLSTLGSGLELILDESEPNELNYTIGEGDESGFTENDELITIFFIKQTLGGTQQVGKCNSRACDLWCFELPNCTGTTNYLVSTNSTASDSSCYCDVKNVTEEQMHVNSLGTSTDPVIEQAIEFIEPPQETYDELIKDLDPHRHATFSQTILARRSGPDETLTLDVTISKIFVTAKTAGLVQVEFLTWKEAKYVYHETVEFVLPPELKSLTGVVKVTLLESGSPNKVEYGDHTGSTKCFTYLPTDSRYYTKLSCAETTAQNGFIFLWSFLSVIALWCFCCLMKPFRKLMKYIWCCVKPTICCCYKLTKASTDKVVDTISEKTKPYREMSDDEEKGTSNGLITVRPLENTRIKPMFWGMFICLTAVSACQDSLIVGVDMKKCKTQNDIITCLTSVSSLAFLNNPKQQLCLDLQDRNSGVSAGRFEVELNDLQIEHPLTFEYYTSSFRVTGESRRYCYLSELSSTVCPKRCDAVHPDDTSAYGTLFGNLVRNRPGISRCVVVAASLVSEGCAFNTGCSFSRGIVDPEGEILAVYSIGTPRIVPHVTAKFVTDIGTSLLVQGPWVGSEVKTIGEVRLQLNGFLNLQTVAFKDLGVVVGQNTGLWSLRPISSAGTPLKTKIGDIQSSSISGLELPSATSFIFDSNLINPTEKPNGVTYNYDTPSAEKKVIFPIPGIYDGQVMYGSGSKLSYNWTGYSPLVLGIETPNGLTVTKSTLPVCPDIIKLVNVYGCRVCDVGFQITLKAKSSCHQGVALLKLKGPGDFFLTDASVFLEEIESVVTISGKTNETYNKFTICLYEEDREACQYIEFPADLVNKVGNQSFLQGEGVKINVPLAWGTWDKWLDFFSPRNWWKMFLILVGCVAIFFLFKAWLNSKTLTVAEQMAKNV